MSEHLNGELAERLDGSSEHLDAPAEAGYHTNATDRRHGRGGFKYIP